MGTAGCGIRSGINSMDFVLITGDSKGPPEIGDYQTHPQNIHPNEALHDNPNIKQHERKAALTRARYDAMEIPLECFVNRSENRSLSRWKRRKRRNGERFSIHHPNCTRRSPSVARKRCLPLQRGGSRKNFAMLITSRFILGDCTLGDPEQLSSEHLCGN